MKHTKNITLLDGGSGTRLWALAEAIGAKREPVWKYNMTHPEIVTQVAKEYIAAGSQIIYTNTFSANVPSVAQSSDYSVEEVVRAGVRAAKQAALDSGVKVALDIGPLPELMEPYGDLEEDEVIELYETQIGAGMAEGADLIVLETFLDLAMMEVAAKVAKSYGVPVFCTMTFEKHGRTIMGNSVEDIVESLSEIGVDAVGMNCSLGPDLALPIIREFSEKTDLPLIFKPNAGLPVVGPDGKTVSAYSAEMFAEEIAPALEFVSYVGGCCGSDESYIRALKALIDA